MSTAAAIAPGLPAGPGPQPSTAGPTAESGFDFAGLLAAPPAETLAAALLADLEPAPEALPDTAAEPLAEDDPLAALFGLPLPQAMPLASQDAAPAPLAEASAPRPAPTPHVAPYPTAALAAAAIGTEADADADAGAAPAPAAAGRATGAPVAGEAAAGVLPPRATASSSSSASAALAAPTAFEAPTGEAMAAPLSKAVAAPAPAAEAPPPVSVAALAPAPVTPRFAALADLPQMRAPQVDAGDFADAVGTRLTWMAEHRIGRAEIRVSPPELGAIDITLKLDGKQVRAEFASAHADVRAALEAGLPRLRDMMAGQGLTLAHAEVGGQGGGGAGGQSAARGGEAAALAGQPADRPAAEDGDEGTARLGAAMSRHDGLLDEYA
ncbi:flagellar hook-length control protein FliK [Rehaibacterium terrae]|jgi:flagellar hook-length control protein FliK|uniref:Flagellar hook-length control protein FliK n=1 Tax=Rehaibacterium terrae TaxID=1341696 RepID=A0A7W7Y2N2_9GAMM|nr:flagellar hook-length control protein FliK [Rehaibacterium terrae]MBB5016723.1 flagellar hook-length control protein FliK [Rehaibacterium terrae]